MKGRRVYANIDGRLALAAGDYGQEVDGGWYCCTPNGNMGNLGNHLVTEHPDGTITVSPSILVTVFAEGEEKELWHGYLEAGVWRHC